MQYVGYKEKNHNWKARSFYNCGHDFVENDTGYIIEMITFCLKIISKILVRCFTMELLFCEQLTDIHQERKKINKVTS